MFSVRTFTVVLDETSAKCTEVFVLYLSNIFSVSRNVVSLTSQIATEAPASLSKIDRCLPIPEPAPVMTATLSLKLFIFFRIFNS